MTTKCSEKNLETFTKYPSIYYRLYFRCKLHHAINSWAVVFNDFLKFCMFHIFEIFNFRIFFKKKVGHPECWKNKIFIALNKYTAPVYWTEFSWLNILSGKSCLSHLKSVWTNTHCNAELQNVLVLIISDLLEFVFFFIMFVYIENELSSTLQLLEYCILANAKQFYKFICFDQNSPVFISVSVWI